jgi:tRNA (mo5U34)-methyltransferase
VEHRLAGDPTNWWAPNHACVEAMLRSCGLHVIARPADETYLCVPTPQDSWLGEWVHEELDRATGR